jgi:hypothetical protein
VDTASGGVDPFGKGRVDVEAGDRAGAVEDALVVGEEELTDRSSPGDLGCVWKMGSSFGAV